MLANLQCARDNICHIGSQSIICKPTEVILTPLPLIYRPLMDERLSWKSQKHLVVY